MRAKDRYAAIERELRLHGKANVNWLAKALGTSVISIRRDLNVLQERGVAKRIHGGAVFVGDPLRPLSVPHAGPNHSGAEAPSAGVFTERSPKRDDEIIGLIVPGAAYYYAGVIAGAEEMANSLGFRLVLAVSGYSGERERKQVERLIGIGAKGLIIAPSVHASEDGTTYDLLSGLNIPAVLMERNADLQRLDVVYSDHAVGAAEGLKHLADLGHMGAALIAGAHSPTTPGLASGFERAQKWFHPDRCRTFLVPSLVWDEERTKQLHDALDWCLAHGTTAVLVHSDEMALLFAQIAVARGLRIPTDLSIVAYDDEIAALADPPLDAVSPPKREVGRQAVKLCAERLEAGTAAAPPRHIGLLPQYIHRRSTAPPQHG